jgi:ABC-type uncharacterized transport system YnjBCD substrate-binding protein
MCLYDIQNTPFPELSNRCTVCIKWSLHNAEELAATELTAREIAIEVCDRYWQWVDELQAASERKFRGESEHLADMKKQNQQMASVKNDLVLFQALTAVFSMAFCAAVYLSVAGL